MTKSETTTMKKTTIHLLLLLLTLIATLTISTLPVAAQTEAWLDDVTEAVKLDGVPAWRLYVTDVDGDRYPDIFIVNGVYKRGQLHLFVNRPDPENPNQRIFVDITEESQINTNPDASITDGRVADVGALADIDNDGDVDLVTGRFWYSLDNYSMEKDGAEVMLNDGTGHFSHVKNDGLDKEKILNATGMSFLDYNKDGNLDLYVGTFSVNHAISYYQNDMLFKGNGDGTFTNVTTTSGIGRVEQPLYGVSVGDWNNDGWADVITAPYCRTNGSLWMNNGDGTFTDVAPMVGYSARATGGDHGQNLCQWEGLPYDFDNDGDLDILQVLVHGGYQPGEGRTVISVNGGAADNYSLKWEHNRIARSAPPSSHLGDMSASWIDLDLDGLVDLVIDQSQYPQANTAGQERTYLLMQQEAGNLFVDKTAEFGMLDSLSTPGASELIDYDLDGDDDLLIVVNTNRNQKNSLHLLENRVDNDNNRIGVKLIAPKGVNHDAIGARITVTANGRTQMQEVTAGHGHFGGQQPLFRNFGVGSAKTIDKIEVRWPGIDVANTVVTNVDANQTITVNGLLGVDDQQVSDDRYAVTLSPQPAKNNLQVTHKQILAGNQWELFDSEGARVIVGQTSYGSTTIDLANIPSGRYVLLIKSDKATVTRPVIVRR